MIPLCNCEEWGANGYDCKEVLPCICRLKMRQGKYCNCDACKFRRENYEMTKQNTRFEYCGYSEESSDRDFLGFIYARLNQVFGESPTQGYMIRLEKMIDSMPGNIRIGCSCSVSDKCPQGKRGTQDRCSIWVDNPKYPIDLK